MKMNMERKKEAEWGISGKGLRLTGQEREDGREKYEKAEKKASHREERGKSAETEVMEREKGRKDKMMGGIVVLIDE